MVIRGMKTVRELQSQPPGDYSKKLAKSLQVVQRGAQSLHAAITSSWATGCHTAHRVMLNLRSDVNSENQRPKTRSLQRSPICFRIFISADGDETNSDMTKWHPMSVQVQEDDQSDAQVTYQQVPPQVLTTRSSNSMGHPMPEQHLPPQVTFSGPLPSPAQGEAADEYQPLTNICLTIRQCSLNNPTPWFKVATGRLLLPKPHIPKPYLLPNSGWVQTQVFAIDRHRVMNLANFLNKTSGDEEVQLGFSQRTELALCIATSMLSFQSTQWLEKPWTKDSIHFFLKGQSESVIDVNQPVVMRIVQDSTKNAVVTSQPTLSDPKSALLELGILLLELWHHRTLEEWAAQTKGTYKDTPEDRRIAATRWLEMTSNRLTIKYTSAVEGCLAFCAGRLRSWEEDEFRRQICEDIIRPLKENCKAW
jgi:hypothetical protein